MALTIWLAFQNWSAETGLRRSATRRPRNGLEIFGPTSVGREFKGALFNTAIYSFAFVALILPAVDRARAPGSRQHVKGGGPLRTILFSTYMAPMIAVALVWSKLYSPIEGPINGLAR